MRKFYGVTDFSKFSKSQPSVQLRISDLLDAIKLTNRYLTNKKFAITNIPSPKFFEQDQEVFNHLKQVEVKSPSKIDIGESRVTLNLKSEEHTTFGDETDDDEYFY